MVRHPRGCYGGIHKFGCACVAGSSVEGIQQLARRMESYYAHAKNGITSGPAVERDGTGWFPATAMHFKSIYVFYTPTVLNISVSDHECLVIIWQVIPR